MLFALQFKKKIYSKEYSLLQIVIFHVKIVTVICNLTA